jgi:hypothetical protein
MGCTSYSPVQWFNGEDISIEDILKYNEDADDVAVKLEVDLEYPNEFHDLHNDYPPACEIYQPKGDNCYRLC